MKKNLMLLLGCVFLNGLICAASKKNNKNDASVQIVPAANNFTEFEQGILRSINEKINELRKVYPHLQQDLGGAAPATTIATYPNPNGEGFYYVYLTDGSEMLINPVSKLPQVIEDIKSFLNEKASGSCKFLSLKKYQAGTRWPAIDDNLVQLFGLDIKKDGAGASTFYRLYAVQNAAQ